MTLAVLPRRVGRPPGSKDRNGRANRVDAAFMRSDRWRSFRIALGATIRERREELNISASELAASIHANVASIHAWERGRSVPTVSTLMAIAMALGCALADLLPDQARYR